MPAAREPLRWPCYKETLYKCLMHYITMRLHDIGFRPDLIGEISTFCMDEHKH